MSCTDELLPWSTDPCDTCTSGIAKFRCYDNIRRCQHCIDELIERNGWNEFP